MWKKLVKKIVNLNLYKASKNSIKNITNKEDTQEFNVNNKYESSIKINLNSQNEKTNIFLITK